MHTVTNDGWTNRILEQDPGKDLLYYVLCRERFNMATPIEQPQPTEKTTAKTDLPPGLGGQLLSTYEAAQILAQSNNVRNNQLSASLHTILPQDVISFDNNAQAVQIKDVDPGQNMVLKTDGTYSQTDANGQNPVKGTWKNNGAGVELDLPNISTVIYPDGTHQDLKSWNGVVSNKDGTVYADGPELNFNEKSKVTPQKDGSSELSVMGDNYILNSDGKTGQVKGSNEQVTYQKVGDDYDITFANGAKLQVSQGIGKVQSEEVTLPNDDAAKGLPKDLQKLWNKNANKMELVG
jgi:hypothetical protein